MKQQQDSPKDANYAAAVDVGWQQLLVRLPERSAQRATNVLSVQQTVLVEGGAQEQ